MIVFVTAYKANKLYKTREHYEKRIKTIIAERIELFLKSRAHQSSQNDIESNKGEDGLDDAERFLDRRSTQEFRKLLEETGLDRSDVQVQGLAKGKQGSVNLLAVQLGVDNNILMLITSLARHDQDAMLDAAVELGKNIEWCHDKTLFFIFFRPQVGDWL